LFEGIVIFGGKTFGRDLRNESKRAVFKERNDSKRKQTKANKQKSEPYAINWNKSKNTLQTVKTKN
jgi:hypothetical protein